MKIVFFGSDDFAEENLKALISCEHDVVACVTQPDRATGRHMQVIPLPVKLCAQNANVSVLQPKNLSDSKFIEELKSYNADLFVIVAYGNFLPDIVRIMPKLFSINVHASLLPKYRGAAPINWTIINGETQTGLTIFKINEKMDSGQIIAQCHTKIDPEDTSVMLRGKMAIQSKSFLVETLDRIQKGDYELINQDESRATFAPKLSKQDGLIDWARSASDIYNTIRGLAVWPGAFSYYSGKMLKILDASCIDYESGKFEPGQVVGFSDNGMIVTTGSGALCVKRVHLASSKEMDAKSFVIGHKIGIGFRLGNK